MISISSGIRLHAASTARTAMVGAGLSYAVYAQAANHAIDRGLDATGAVAGIFGVAAVLLAPLLRAQRLDWLGTGRGLGALQLRLAVWAEGFLPHEQALDHAARYLVDGDAPSSGSACFFRETQPP